jgi:iron-sulfur cluster repair protein YtfE (RIC family)
MSAPSVSRDLGSVAFDLHRRHLNELLERVEIDVDPASSGKARAAFAKLRRELDEHVRLEEQLLSPSLDRRRRSQSGPSAIMRAEHEEMRRLLDAVEGVL